MHADRASSADRELVYELCISHLDLQGLACVSTTRKRFKELSYDVLRMDATKALLRTLPAAAATAAAVDPAPQRRVQHQLNVVKRAVQWLMRLAPDKAAAALAAEAVSARMVCIPAVQYSDAEQLLRAGVCIRYKQLLDAAGSMVPGVGVWVRAQQQLGIQTDIPAAAVAICCGNNWVS
jgi:hypothetical protein